MDQGGADKEVDRRGRARVRTTEQSGHRVKDTLPRVGSSKGRVMRGSRWAIPLLLMYFLK